MTAPDLAALIRVLSADRVEFIIVGGIAATIHGSAHLTYDLDVVYHRTHENIDRLVRALAPHQPYLRGAPPGLPFRFDADTVWRGLNFTLQTTLGDVDLLGEVIGGGSYEQLLQTSETARVFGYDVTCVTLQRLIALKRAAGRRKDLNVLAELEALLDERGRREDA